MKTKYFFILPILSCILSCNAQDKKQQEPVTLIDSALQLMASSSDSNDIRKAISLFDKAIAIDKTYWLAYSNKAIALCKLEKYESAISVLNEILNEKPDFVEAITTQGFIYEKIGNIDLALKNYYKAKNIYDQRIQNSFKIEDKLNSVFLTLFLKDKSTAMNELKQLDREFPNQPKILQMISMLNEFNRNEFINSMCQ